MSQTTTILIVDDSELDRRLIGGLLRCNPYYRLEMAADGKEALERMSLSAPDIVVTDLVMPEMDGLQLLQILQDRYPEIPVILMTAHGNETLAVESLRAGAASYVPKARQAEQLMETVERVEARLQSDRNRKRLTACLDEIYSSYTLENEPALVTSLVDEIQQFLARIGLGDAAERIRTCVALEEALLNAMYHGNLDISDEELAAARATSRREGLARLVEQRRGLPECRDRRIQVDVHISQIGAHFVIRDDGNGFDPQAASNNRLGDYFETGRNRGLMLMLSHMDEVRFNDAGNQVTLIRDSPAIRRQRRARREHQPSA